MIEVTEIRVRSLSVDFNELSWDIASTGEDVLDYTFQVLRSEAAAGPWDVLSPEMEDRYIFIDNRILNANKYRQFHYLLRVKHKPTGTTKDYGPATRDARPDLIALEIRKHINLLTREFVGRRCWVLPARTFGQHCPACFDTDLNQRTTSGCRTCFDTGYVRGYMTPIETWVQIDPNQNSNTQTVVGEQQQNNTTARMGYFPPLKPKDLVIEPENRRWRVTAVTGTERLRAQVHQEVQIHEIPTTDIEYAIDINLGTGIVTTAFGDKVEPLSLRTLALAGSRNFTNPHTLESFESEEIPKIYSLYPTTYAPVK